jgi:hypothetical protein
MIVALPALLYLADHIRAAVATLAGHDAFDLVGCLRQWAVFVLARRALACLRLAPFATLLAEIVLRRRDVLVRGCLARLANQALKFDNPRCHPLDHLVLRKQKLILLSFAQHMKRGWGHPKGESNSESPRNPFLPTS